MPNGIIYVGICWRCILNTHAHSHRFVNAIYRWFNMHLALCRVRLCKLEYNIRHRMLHAKYTTHQPPLIARRRVEKRETLLGKLRNILMMCYRWATNISCSNIAHGNDLLNRYNARMEIIFTVCWVCGFDEFRAFLIDCWSWFVID